MVAPGAPATAGTPPAAAAPPGPEHTVTLITGDRVTVAERQNRWELVRIEPANRVPASGYLQDVGPDGVTVIPEVAAPLVRSGQLDKALFDVSGLVELGYDDAHTKEIPLLVESEARAASALGRITRALPAAGLTAVATPKDQVTTLFDTTRSTRSATRIWLNGKAYPTLDQSVPQVGAPDAWASGHTGAGATIAVLDTGYDANHPDLAGVVTGERDFVGGGMTDQVGHGTHVASTAAGRGTAAGGTYTGVAKGANLLVGKVCAPSGCPYDAMIAGMQWAAESGARVVNMSIGGGPSDGTDPLSTEINRLTAAHGTLFVVAAGNWGAPGTVTTPAAADSALAVASVTKQDTMSDFSSRGPRAGDFALKPDIAAPGSDIVAARAEGTLPDEAVDEHYARLSGTSMATPHVAGAAAILAVRHPDWTAEKLKSALMSSAHPVEAGVYEQGTGRLDVARAVRQQVTANPASLNLGFVRPPTVPEPKKVTYHNAGTAPVTFSLALTAWHESGQPAPAGVFSTDVDDVTVPAGGEAAVTVTFDSTAGPAGSYGGRLVATAGDTVVQTTIGGYEEPESHYLTLNLIDRDGTALPSTASGSFATIVNLDDRDVMYFVSSTAKVWLPVGRYAVMSVVRTPIPGTVSRSTTSIGEPELHLDKDTTLTLDARRGNRVRLEVDERDARLIAGVSGMSVNTDAVRWGVLTEFSENQYAVPTGEPREHFAYYNRAQLEQPVIRLNVTAPESFEVPVTWAPSSPLITDIRGLTAVDVGNARPEEIAARDVRGKLAVFTLSADEEPEMEARLQAVADAGATAIFFYFSETMTVTTDSIPIPTVYTVDPIGVRLARLAASGAPDVKLTGIRSSEYRYELAFPHRGGIPATLHYQPRNRDLATVRADYRALAEGEIAYVDYGARAGDIGMDGGLWSTRIPLPVTRTEYYSPGPVSWRTSVSPQSDLGGGVAHRYRSAERSYRPGDRVTVNWHKGVIAPAFIVPEPYSATPHLVFRDGDTINATLPLLSDSDRHSGLAAPEGWGFADKGDTALYVGDTLVSRSGVPGSGTFSVPAAAGNYRLVSTVTRDHPAWPLSTSVSGEWTFHSGHTNTATPLPLLAIGFDPKLDELNYAPAGKRFTFPVTVDRQVGTTGPRAALTTVEVSFDDGMTWRRVAPEKVGNHWQVTVRHPASGFVSLRASATDGDGNTVTETVIRAYRLRPVQPQA